MAGDSLKIEIDVETRQAIAGLASVMKGLAGTEEGAKKTQSAFDRFNAAQKNVSDTAERYHSNLSRGVGVLVSFTQSVIAGTVAHERSERAMRTLGSAYNDVVQQTRGAVTAAEALRAQQSLVQSGLQLSGEELGRVTRAAREYALATGTETTQALEQLTGALRGGEAEGLRAFGITLEANSTRSHSFRTALNQLETQQRAMAPSAQSMAEANANLGRTWDSLTSSLFADFARWGDLQSNMNGVADALRTLREAHGDVSSLIDGGREGVQVRAAALSDNARLDLRARYDRAAMRLQNDVPENMQGRMNFAPSRTLSDAQLNDFVSRAEQSGTWGQTYEDYIRFADETRGVREGNDSRRAVRQADATGRAAREQAARDAANARSNAPASYDSARFEMVDTINELFRSMLAGGLGSPTDRRATYGSSYGELADLAGAQQGQLSGFGMRSVARRPGESTQDYLARTSTAANDFVTTRNSDRETMTQGLRSKEIAENERAAALADAFTEKGNINARSERANMVAAADAQEEMRLASQAKGVSFAAAANDNARRENPGAQLRDAFLPAALETQTAAEKMAEGVSGAFATMTGAVKSHVAALIEGRETAGQAMLGIAHDTLLALATEAVGRSLMSLGGALAATAVGSPTAPLLYASAAAYAGVAALAGAGAAATGAAMAGAAPAAAAGSRTPPAAASAGGSGRGSSEGSTVVINVNGTVMDREGTADSIRELLNDSLSRGGVLRPA